MKQHWKQAIGAVALSAMLIGPMAGTLAKPPKKEIQKPIPRPNAAEEVAKPEGETSPETPPTETPGTDRGIKDNGVKGCGNCGITGREKAPDAAQGEGDTPASGERKRGSQKPVILNPDGTVARTKAPGKGNTALLAVGGLGALATIFAVASGGKKSP